MSNFVLYFNFPNAIFEYMLPAENNRKLSLDLSSRIGAGGCRINLEVWDGVWHITRSGELHLCRREGGKTVQDELEDEVLKAGDVITGRMDEKRPFTILVMNADANLSHFTKYDIAGENEVSAGKNESCSIRLYGEYVSGSHMNFSRRSDGWYLTDTSRNGVYLNNYRIAAASPVGLKPFDSIYTAGYRFVFLGEYLAVNQTDSVKSSLPEFRLPECGTEAPAAEIPQAFSRSPRMMEPLDKESVTIEGPPAPNSQKKQPLLFTLGPALTMPLPILTTMLLRMNAGASYGNTYWVMGVSVVLSAVIGLGWSLARRKYDERQLRLSEQDRVGAYLSYIEKNRSLLEEKQNSCRELLLSQYPSSRELMGRFGAGGDRSQFWNRNVHHKDFGVIRLGLGKMKLPGNISVPKERFSVVNDELAEKPRILEKAYEIVAGVPARLDLCKNKLVGVVGDAERLPDIARSMAVQLSALHSYSDMKLAFLFDKGEEAQYSWTRWLPHVFSADRKLRMVADDPLSHQNVLYALCNVLQQRAQTDSRDEKLRQMPMYVVFCTVDGLLSSHSIWKYVTDTADYNVCFVLLYGQMDRLPNICKCILEADESYNGAYQLDEAREETNDISWETVSAEAADRYARSMSGMFLRELAAGEIPDSINFLEMYGLADIRRWDLMKHWKENRAYEGLSAQIGVGNGNRPVYLDIHEKQHGPHGLVAGTTGSGKSETLQTFILSLILNYHPDEVAFILIDYKGGGMANLFQGIPHIAGTITNIDDSGADTNQTHRALVSLQSEIKRRQRVFNDYSVNHIDAYSRLYKDGRATEAMPHLIIISDEFAELKKEQPDFIKELVSAARVGRSLGIHLILATQKPSGVVDDEIWSNSRFKLCLRVQDRQDSMEMLKRPEAALLTKTGRGYLQIGNNESFELFQSGWSGAAYAPDENVQLTRDTTVSMIGLDGSELVVRGKKKANKNSKTQLDACVDYIRETAAENHISSARPLWLPMLPSFIAAEELEGPEDDGITAVLGRADMPEKQLQPLFTVHFPACGNILVSGVTGCGKSSLVRTMLYSLCARYTPETVNFYIFDFSNHSFDCLRSVPHCGGIAYADDEEKIERMFRLVGDMLEQRDRELVRAGASTADEYRKMGFGTMPLVLVVIDNYASFIEQYGKYEDTFQKMSRRGLPRGIQFIVTLNALNDMRAKLRQNFSFGIPLRLNERMDYSEVLGSTPAFMPQNRPGSGLTKLDGTIVEYQAAAVSDIKAAASAAKLSPTGFSARKIRYIDKEQSFADFYDQARRELPDPEKLPYGWNVEPIEPAFIDLRKTFCWFISDTVGKSGRGMLENVLYVMQKEKRTVHYVSLGGSAAAADKDTVIYRNKDEVFELMKYLKSEFTRRTQAKKEALSRDPSTDAQAYLLDSFPRIFVLFDDFNQFTELAYADSENKMYNLMEVLLEKGRGYGIYFIAVWNKAIYSGNYLRPMCRRFSDCGCGVHLGGRLDAQKLIDTGLTLTEQVKPRAPGEGFAVDGMEVRQVFVPIDAEVKAKHA